MVVATVDRLRNLKDGAKRDIGEMRADVTTRLANIRGALEGINTRNNYTLVSKSEAEGAITTARQKVIQSSAGVYATTGADSVLQALYDAATETVGCEPILFEMLATSGVDLKPLLEALNKTMKTLRDSPAMVRELASIASKEVTEAEEEGLMLNAKVAALDKYAARLQAKLAELGGAEKQFESVAAEINDILKRVENLESM
ncbi:MAG: hypothetical protein Q7S22_01960, partial [Candidatus Micrarchaeota archaeon]|nr:hypothetical protein [Candidatus Micrarchaeota archaeon]